jgi:cysteine desulfurase
MGVYLDHNATSPMRPQVREAFLAALDAFPANPSSVHGPGRRARAAMDTARERVAGALSVDEGEILFTSGGTEANNLALFGLLAGVAPSLQGPALVTTRAEHHSILRPAEALAKRGHGVVFVPVDSAGLPNPEEILAAAAPDKTSGDVKASPARLISISAANSEVGAAPDLAAIGDRLAEVAPSRRPLFHADAVQALGRLPIDLKGWGVDLATFSAHKLGGPRGVGILYRASGVPLAPHSFGGEQELGLRAGTENVAAIVAASHAVEIAVVEREAFAARARAQVALLLELMGRCLPDARLLGPPFEQSPDSHLTRENRLPNTANFLIPGVDGRVLITRLDLAGLETSAGSACASGSLEPSHVLLAMGLAEDDARAGLRLSIGWNTTDEDIHRAVGILGKTCSRVGAT